MKYPDLMEAYKKHKSKGGKGNIKSWGKLHYDRHGKKEEEKFRGRRVLLEFITLRALRLDRMFRRQHPKQFLKNLIGVNI